MSLYLGNNLISGATTPIEPTKSIGQIIQSIIPLTDAGLRLLDGSLIQGGGVYDAFVQYIASLSGSYPQCFTDETTWQNTVSSKGACGKFVYNSTNNTVRLPKITGFIEGTVDSSALGELVNAGLPNINGEIYAGHGSDGSSSGGLGIFRDGSGCFSEQNTKQYCPQASTTGWAGSASNLAYSNMKLNASLSNSIYGNSTTVQPQSIKVFYYIVIATTTKTDIEVDIDEVITDLNTIDSNAVHKTGDETISGEKTFTNTIIESTLSTDTGSYVDFIQKINGARRGTIRTMYNSDGSYQVTLGCNGPDAAAPSGLIVKRTSSAITAIAPTPAVSNNSTEIATTAYVNNKFQVVSTLPASPDSNVFYFIPE